MYSITINRATHTLTLYKDGKPFRSYSAAVGKPATPTPTGSFKIINKASAPGGAFGARWLGINAPGGGYGIHGTNNPSSIGKSVSNGCIRLQNEAINELYRLVPIGTPVRII